jgi:hypothetical protein
MSENVAQTEQAASSTASRATWKKLLVGLMFAGAGLAVGYLAARFGFDSGRASGAGEKKSAAVALAGFGLALLAIWLALAIHEAGHALGGVSRGFRFLFLAAGPLWIERREGRLAVRFNTASATWGGVAACVPVDGRDLPRRFAVMVAGGPIASLALALLAGLLGAATPRGTAHFLAGVTALASACFFLATAQPFGAGGGFASDGGRLMRILRGGVEGAREAALLGLTAAAMGGARPRDWPAALLAEGQVPADGSMMEVAALVYAAQADVDRGALDEAAARLERAERLTAGKGKLLRSIMAGEAAWLAATRGEMALARALLAEADGPFTERHLLLRAEAAVLLSEGDRAGARAAAEAGLAALPKARYGRPSAWERELLEGLREAAS